MGRGLLTGCSLASLPLGRLPSPFSPTLLAAFAVPRAPGTSQGSPLPSSLPQLHLQIVGAAPLSRGLHTSSPMGRSPLAAAVPHSSMFRAAWAAVVLAPLRTLSSL